MADLSREFQKSIQAMGLTQDGLKQAVFYCAPIGLRFEIGGKESVYQEDAQDDAVEPHSLDMTMQQANGRAQSSVNPDYFYNALCRAASLYAALPSEPDILRIDLRGECLESRQSCLELCAHLGMPPASEHTQENDPDGYPYTAFYWSISDLSPDIPDRLIREIIMADLGGNSLLSSSVYFLNVSSGLLYHLYDDRGADLIAASRTALWPFYHRFQIWLLSYNRKKMDELFLDYENSWHTVKDQEDVDHLLQVYGGFHDSCLVSTAYTSGCGVDEKGAMYCGMPDQKVLHMTFHSQWTRQPLELCFSGVRMFHIAGWQEDRFCEILDCYLKFHTDLIRGGDTRLIVWADSDCFSPYRTKSEALLDESMDTYVAAESLKWRFL